MKEGRLCEAGLLQGRKKTVGDAVCSDGEGGMSVFDGFGASRFRKEEFSCCNLCLLARATVKSACS